MGIGPGVGDGVGVGVGVGVWGFGVLCPPERVSDEEGLEGVASVVVLVGFLQDDSRVTKIKNKTSPERRNLLLINLYLTYTSWF
jgi:hypothetical protein